MLHACVGMFAGLDYGAIEAAFDRGGECSVVWAASRPKAGTHPCIETYRTAGLTAHDAVRSGNEELRLCTDVHYSTIKPEWLCGAGQRHTLSEQPLSFGQRGPADAGVTEVSDTWPKLIRDPVHNIIPFEKCDRLLLQLINTREFQRLRRIKQLGLSQLVFPGADHSRFAHSIGVMHIARRIVDRVAQLRPGSVTDDQRIAVLAAALLHDVGHGPFSHAFEKITGEKHEQRTLDIIGSDSTEVNGVLKKADPDLPDRLKVFFDEDIEEEGRAQAEIPGFLTQVVSSQLDADRFDYLLRDSRSTGAEYGRFDIEWMLQHLGMDDTKGRFFLGHKALHAGETYVFARYHMYRSVYFHKTTRAAEVMLRLLFRRFKKRLMAASNAGDRERIVRGAPPMVCRVLCWKHLSRRILTLGRSLPDRVCEGLYEVLGSRPRRSCIWLVAQAVIQSNRRYRFGFVGSRSVLGEGERDHRQGGLRGGVCFRSRRAE